MLRALLSPFPAESPRLSWPTRAGWLAPLRAWMNDDKSGRALAQVDDDHLSELSELGRARRREARDRKRG